MKQLSQREKMLLYAAAVLALACLLYYVLELPSGVRLEAAREEYERTSGIYGMMIGKAGQAETIKEELAEAEAYCKEQEAVFGPVRSTFEVERELEDLFREAGLTVTAADFYEAEPADMGGKKESTIFSVGSVHAVVSGEPDGFYRALEELAARKDLLVTAFSQAESGEQKKYEIEISCYMVEFDASKADGSDYKSGVVWTPVPQER